MGAILDQLISEHKSMRAFARSIHEDASDVHRWQKGKGKMKLRAVIEVCRQYPNVKPFDLNPEEFPEDLLFKFTKERNK